VLSRGLRITGSQQAPEAAGLGSVHDVAIPVTVRRDHPSGQPVHVFRKFFGVAVVSAFRNASDGTAEVSGKVAGVCPTQRGADGIALR
jgi:hypothetical protein